MADFLLELSFRKSEVIVSYKLISHNNENAMLITLYTVKTF